jgi:hypothetical protein
VLAAVAVLVAACGGDKVTAPGAAPIFGIDSGVVLLSAVPAPTAVNFGTYEGSGQVVHPDVVEFADKWNGHRYWTAITPYPNSVARFENPSLYASDDGDSWQTPVGVTNPLSSTNRGYLSDPDMVFDSTSGQMRLYYREVQSDLPNTKKEKHISDNVWMTTSTNATQWSAPIIVATDSAKFVVSPSIVRTPEKSWRMYQVDAGRGGCRAKTTRVVMRRSTDGTTWTNSDVNGLTQPGYQAWHMDVEYVANRHEYWALVAAYPNGQSCMSTSLFLLTSKDGLQWTSYAAPVLARGAVPEFSAEVYRSTFTYDRNNSVTIWFSGARTVTPGTKKVPAVLAWSAAVTHTTADALIALVNNSANAAVLSVTGIPGTTLAPATSVP